MKSLDEVKLSDRDRRAVEEAARILRERFPVERVILFGSKTRGDDTTESDIDLLVLTSREMTWQEQGEITSSLYHLQLELNVLFSTVVIWAGEWDEGIYQVHPLYSEVARDGVPV